MNGLVGAQSICVAIAIVDLMQVTNPIINVLRVVVKSSCVVGVLVFNDSRYFAPLEKNFCHVSLLWRRRSVSSFSNRISSNEHVKKLVYCADEFDCSLTITKTRMFSSDI